MVRPPRRVFLALATAAGLAAAIGAGGVNQLRQQRRGW
ncbi:twin-arginine translocation signal domain-containing protein [Cyanobium gracile]|nr:twin-arginine translocation signal domain-containing protein [Cyanobium gracile]